MSPERRTARLPARSEFGDFDGRVWLNTAHQGPLPLAAVAAAARAGELKQYPHRMADADFTEVPERLRTLLGRLVGADPGEIVLGDSTSHGIHLIANELRFAPGDEVLVVAGDYPATVLPWLRLRDQGVTVREVRPVGSVLSADDVEASIRDRTRVLALTWVNSFTGQTVDLDAVGAVGRTRDVAVVANASQAIGARPFDAASTAVDAVVSCGYKWLCGPYGTGFTWLHPSFGAQLRPQHAYWLAMQAGRGLDQMRDSAIRHDLGVRAFDRFCPADFFDSLPWIAALELMLEVGIAAIAEHDQRLVQRLLEGLDPERYQLVSPADGGPLHLGGDRRARRSGPGVAPAPGRRRDRCRPPRRQPPALPSPVHHRRRHRSRCRRCTMTRAAAAGPTDLGNDVGVQLPVTPVWPRRTPRLILRPFEAADLESLLIIQSDPAAVRYVPYPPRDRVTVALVLEKKITHTTLAGAGDLVEFAVTLADDGTLIGDVLLALRSVEHQTLEVGYIFAPAYGGQGYATEAVRALLDLAFGILGARRVIARVDDRNVASRALLDRLGFGLEAHLVDNEWFKGELTSEVDYAILAQNWPG